MFGFFEKQKTKESSSILAFDLAPLVNSLSSADRVHFRSIADAIHTEIHPHATLSGWSHLMQCWVVKKKGHGYTPEIATPAVASFLASDIDFTKSVYEIAFPISTLNSVAALEHLVNRHEPQNDILSMISGECAVKILKRTLSL